MNHPQNADPGAEAEGLHSLRGARAPAELGENIGAISSLPEAAKAELWRVLGPCLDEPIDPRVEAALDAFTLRHGLDRDHLARVIKGSRFLLRAAASADASKEQFAADLDALTGDPNVGALLTSGFDQAKDIVRQEILRGTLADHGKLLLDVDWRVDRMMASQRGDGLHTDVVVLTLHTREGDRSERVTLQILPETLRKLSAICARFT